MSGSLIPIIAVLIVAFGAVAVYASRETRAETKRTGKYPKGHYLSKGMGAGIAIGVGIGVAMGNIGVGIPIGIALGVGMGASMEKKHAQELRPRTDKEKKMKLRGIALSGVLLVVTVLIVVYLNSLKS
jgi:uncharacterized membrane protein YfcA